MSFVRVKEETCTTCGLCAGECPAGVLSYEGKGHLPQGAPQAEQRCLACGHCVAICPTQSISVGALKAGGAGPIQRELLPSAGGLELWLKTRRSCRSYTREPVAREQLEKVIDIARYAPSAGNGQPLEWTIYESWEEVQGLAEGVVDWMRYTVQHAPEVAGPYNFAELIAAREQGLDPVLRGAPHVLIAHAAGGMMPQADAAIGITYAELAALSLGLGTCWAGFLMLAYGNFPPLREKVALPEGHRFLGALMLGHPRQRYQSLPERKRPQLHWR